MIWCPARDCIQLCLSTATEENHRDTQDSEKSISWGDWPTFLSDVQFENVAVFELVGSLDHLAVEFHGTL